MICSAKMSKAYLAGTAMGTCSHPLCVWSGQRVNYGKHKEGCGKAENFRPGKHVGCACCNFVPDQTAAPGHPSSVLQHTLAALGQQEHVSLHKHMQGEVHRTARMDERCALPFVSVIMVLTLTRIVFLSSQQYNVGHAQFCHNPHPVADQHTR